MILSSWRKRRAKKNKKGADNLELNTELSIPTHFRCPISLDLMRDPVTLSTGITYDRDSIETWFESGNQTCPVTNQVLHSFDQIPNHAIRKMIQEWCVLNRSRGVERIPTPRVPVSPYEVSATCNKIISAASSGGDRGKCADLVARIRAWGRDSDRNKRCVSDNGTGYVLATLLETLASDVDDNDDFSEECVGLMQDVLSVLTWTFPKGHDGRRRLGSEPSLRCMTWLLRNGNLSSRQNVLHVLKELLASDESESHVRALSETENAVEALVDAVKTPICPAATSSSLMIIFYMVSTKQNSSVITSKFVELGLVPMIIELLVDGDKGTCERALGVLDRLCETEKGREEAEGHAMTVGVVVKKMLRVSEAATEFALSVLWKLSGREEAVVEAVQVGAFQKVLVLFQVGCGEGIREKATNLLKLLNHYKDKAECVECSMDFRHLKRSC